MNWPEGQRPEIGDRFILPDGRLVEVRAIWDGGVVLDGERVAHVANVLKWERAPIAPARQ